MHKLGAGERAQGLRALALPEDPSSVPSTHMSLHNSLKLQLSEIGHPLLVYMSTHAVQMHKDIYPPTDT